MTPILRLIYQVRRSVMGGMRSFQGWPVVFSLSLPLSDQLVNLLLFLLQLNFKSSVIYLFFPLLISSPSVSVPSPPLLSYTIGPLLLIHDRWNMLWVFPIGEPVTSFYLDQFLFFLSITFCESLGSIQYRLALRHNLLIEIPGGVERSARYLKIVLHLSSLE